MRYVRLSCLALTFICGMMIWGAPAELHACMADCGFCSGCQTCDVEGGTITCTGCSGSSSSSFKPPTVLQVLSPTHARLILKGYKTTNLQPLNACVTALSPVEGIERVNSVVNYNGLTQRPFDQITFSPLDATGPEIAKLAEQQGVIHADTAWSGFLSDITGEVNNNTPNYFIVDLTLDRNVAIDDLVASLKSQGVFVTSSSTHEGLPNPGHQFFRRLGDAGIVVVQGPRDPRDRPVK
jgi:hypothetical protein